ncbi:hypothetical protein [Pseudoalteromonas luteoviolacea]|uniref:Uncharacterized protein n=1 Tax=Pseudoalteromonas luteoviolacea S4060-1 TaxID=1365257 RepID=A0A162BLP9_9GAMM|nr:hypothetical protein [Pseudoalteromonas luteoviolacea]KZN63944.1 hypothetical protein N478_23640 [Pseudoalteromonas luteoviolacea S4060-1]
MDYKESIFCMNLWGVISLSALFPLPHPEVTHTEMWLIILTALLMVLVQVIGRYWFYKVKSVNNAWFAIWGSIVGAMCVFLCALAAYSLLNGQVTMLVLWVMLCPPVIVAIVTLTNRFLSPTFSYQGALEVGKVRIGTWDYYPFKKYGDSKLPSGRNVGVSPKVSTGIISTAAIAGAFATGSTLDAYLLYLANITVCVSFAWIFSWSTWIELAYLIRARFSHV